MGQNSATQSARNADNAVESYEDGQACKPVSLAAHKIKKFRERNKLTAAELGEQLGVSQTAVLFWEYGQRMAGHLMQGKLRELGVCEPGDWHEPAPLADYSSRVQPQNEA